MHGLHVAESPPTEGGLHRLGLSLIGGPRSPLHRHVTALYHRGEGPLEFLEAVPAL
jgi:hypothetical protein